MQLNDFGLLGDQYSAVATRLKRQFIVKHLINYKEPAFLKFSGGTLFFVNQNHKYEKTVSSNSLTDRYPTVGSLKPREPSGRSHNKTQSEAQSRLLIQPCKLNSPKSSHFKESTPFTLKIRSDKAHKSLNCLNQFRNFQINHEARVACSNERSTKQKSFIKSTPKPLSTASKQQIQYPQHVRLPPQCHQPLEGFKSLENDGNTDLYDYIQRKQHF